MNKYKDGMNMKSLKPIYQISDSNTHYWHGLEEDLIFGKSFNKNSTEWYLVEFPNFRYLGFSHIHEGDLLVRYHGEA